MIVKRDLRFSDMHDLSSLLDLSDYNIICPACCKSVLSIDDVSKKSKFLIISSHCMNPDCASKQQFEIKKATLRMKLVSE